MNSLSFWMNRPSRSIFQGLSTVHKQLHVIYYVCVCYSFGSFSREFSSFSRFNRTHADRFLQMVPEELESARRYLNAHGHHLLPGKIGRLGAGGTHDARHETDERRHHHGVYSMTWCDQTGNECVLRLCGQSSFAFERQIALHFLLLKPRKIFAVFVGKAKNIELHNTFMLKRLFKYVKFFCFIINLSEKM